MKTVQEYLREADRNKLLDQLAYNSISDMNLLLEYQDRTVKDIQNACREHMNSFIEELLSLEAHTSDHMVFYMCNTHDYFEFERIDICLINLNEIKKNIDASDYAFDLTAWEESLGFLVAENELTQTNQLSLLVQYLEEISFFGTDIELHEEYIEKLHEDLEQALKEIEEGKTLPYQEVFENISEDYDLPIYEKDEEQDCLYRQMLKAKVEYSRYCHRRERRFILENIGYHLER